MPELPEAETIRADLAKAVLGSRIVGARLRHPGLLGKGSEKPKASIGSEITGIERFGKRLFFLLREGGVRQIQVSLGMTGQFVLGEGPEDAPPHTRLSLYLDKGGGGPGALHFRDIRKFGRVWFASDPGPWKGAPDALNLKGSAFHKLLAGKRQPIKSLLMDQSLVGGLGNIYATEALYAAGISPFREGGSLSEKESGRLLRKTKKILKEAIRLRGSTVSNYRAPSGEGAYQHRLLAYGKAGSGCPICGGMFRKDVIQGRSTVWCPACQK
ncbi:MAG: DNA-formamidopyrimidine glycosylase [Deltaproteobacteria bacterium]|nr:DNA-formamidopyrimidine glycosylase [Deltaproteobacteria bacterium]